MATVRNLPEDYLYRRLPDALVSLDERGLIQAVLGGVQDRVDDLRAYAKNIQKILDPGALPQTGNNVVLVDLVGPKGKAFTRSLDIQDDTPDEEGSSLVTWAAGQLDLAEDALSNVRFGQDLLRLVDADIVGNLAGTIGAILYSSIALSTEEQRQATIDLVDTWFPRLKIKGTAKSFEALGKILGFEDVRLAPLWSRLSPKDPSDVGAPGNSDDFSQEPFFHPAQDFGPLYNPHDADSGPFYTWSGTVSHGTAATDFYTEAVNGFNPWFKTTVLSVQHGTVIHPSSGSYALGDSGSLSLGGPHKKAYVDPPGSTVRFEAIAEGDSFNGLLVQVDGLEDPDKRRLSVYDRLSAIQYRSSYFDLSLAVSMERAEEVFGDKSMQPNKDLVETPDLVSDGTAIGPYRPWWSGSIALDLRDRDWLTQSGTISGVHIQRTQATGARRQQDYEELAKAGAQVFSAMEEVRPATRFPRKETVGYLNRDEIPYSAFNPHEQLFVTGAGTLTYSGTDGTAPAGLYSTAVELHPPAIYCFSFNSIPGRQYQILGSDLFIGPYVEMKVITAEDTVTRFCQYAEAPSGFHKVYDLTTGLIVSQFGFQYVSNLVIDTAAEIDPDNPFLYHYSAATPYIAVDFSGSYDHQSGSYAFNFGDTPGHTSVEVDYQPLNTEVIRAEPPVYPSKSTGTVGYLLRPEDEPTNLDYETFEEYAWRRDIVIGGELVELDGFSGTVFEGQRIVSGEMALWGHDGAEYNLYGYESTSGRLRLITEARPLDKTYEPGLISIAFSGNFRDQAALTPDLVELYVNPHDSDNLRTQFSRVDLDAVFEDGWQLYHAGLVQGVPVADPVKFYGTHHRSGLVCWWPMDEHVDDDLEVVDRSTVAGDQALVGVLHSDRNYGTVHGNYLTLRQNTQIDSFTQRDLGGTYTFSFWLNQSGTLSTFGTDTFLRYGPVSVDRHHHSDELSLYLENSGGSRAQVGSVNLIGNDFNFVHLEVSGSIQYGSGTLGASPTFVSGPYNSFREFSEGDFIRMSGGARDLHLRDLRIWNYAKTQPDVQLIQDHNPTPTIVPYRPGWFYSNERDRYGLSVLPNGWLQPSGLPASLRTPRQAWIKRYDSLGHYEGESRFKEVGLSGGRPLPATFVLGQQFFEMTADGTATFSGTHGLLPGMNALWTSENAADSYLVLNSAGTTTGTVASTLNTGISDPWPNKIPELNPLVEHVWMTGDDGYIYEITLED